MPKKITGWRDKLSRSDSIRKDVQEQAEPAASSAVSEVAAKKRKNSITKLACQIKRKLSFGRADRQEEQQAAERNNASITSINSSSSTAGAAGRADRLEVPEGDGAKSAPVLTAKTLSPLDFILMKEEFIKNNPQAGKKKDFVKERSVESECGESYSMESVMNSLKKIVKVINPKREFPSDVRRKEEEERRKIEAREAERMKRRQVRRTDMCRKYCRKW